MFYATHVGVSYGLHQVGRPVCVICLSVRLPVWQMLYNWETKICINSKIHDNVAAVMSKWRSLFKVKSS